MDEWPLAVITSHGEGKELDAEELIAQIDPCLDRGEPFVTLHDMRGMPYAPAEVRSEFVRRVDVRAERIDGLIQAHAVVVNGQIQRGIVTAVVWFMADRTFDTKAFTDPVAAKAWVMSQYEARVKAQAG